MTLDQLIYFASVYKEGSITKAAKTLFISQSTVSTAINRLEEEFGLLLFERSKKGVQPTHHADVLIDYVQEMLQQSKNIENYIFTQSSDSVHTLRLRSAPTFEQIFLPEFIAKLSVRLPRLQIALLESNSDISITALTNGTVDMAIISYTGSETEQFAENISKKNIAMDYLCQCSMSYYVRANHPLLAYERLQSKTLAQYTLISCDRLMQDSKNHISFSRMIIEHNIRHIKQMLRTDDFIAILPDFLPEKDPYIQSRQIMRLPQLPSQGTTHFGLIYSAQNKLLPIEAEFISLLKQELAVQLQEFG